MLAGTTNYTLHGKNIVHMTQGSNNLHFFYDASNKPAIVEYNGTKYAYVHNLQGDIVAILDSNGTAVVQYKYDAWGRQIGCDVEAGNSNATALSTLNPFRYRGYVYDEETGLYYLRSRYYNATWLRFVNADTLLLPNFNLFCYCMQQPINRGDPNGTDFFDCCWDEMSNRLLWSPMHFGFAAPAYKGNTSGVWDPNGTWARAMAAEEDWINSDFNDGYQTPAHNDKHISTGVKEAPKTSAEPFAEYHRSDNEDRSVIISITWYGADCQPVMRDDYYCGSHPHTHYDKFTHTNLYNHRHLYLRRYHNNKWFVNEGPVVPIPFTE